jgi:signal transduction histidine kinase
MVTVLVERFPRPARLDALLAVPAAAAAVAGSVAAAGGQVRIRPLDAFGVVLVIAAAAAAVGLRRAAPLWALAATTLLVNAYVLAGYPYGPVLLCLVIAVFEVARQRPLATSALTCGIAAALSSATIFVRVVDDHHATWLLALAWTGWSVLPWSLGALDHVVRAARTRATRELIARSALEERMRIAGEVHDIAGHGFALITMQAQVALLVFEEQPEQARRSLEAVRDTSSTALADLRRMLDTFHPRPGPSVPVGSALAPSAAHCPADPVGVADLTELIGQVRASGLPVHVAIDEGCDLPDPVGATVYRVVQEALTNVLRHAGATQAQVTIERREGQMLVSVTDRGRGSSGTVGAPGRGLTGMRRRVEELHGQLEAGPRHGGGFQVRAWLPLSEASA